MIAGLSLFEMQFGFSQEDNIKYTDKTNESRDRYGAKARKEQKERDEWEKFRLEFVELEAKREKPKNRIYNNWSDLTKTQFWSERIKTNISYFGIETKF